MTSNPEDTPLPAPRVGINADLLFDASPMPTWIFDIKDYAFLAVNQAACEHYDYTEEEFLRMTIRDICLPEDFPRVIEQLTRLPFSFEREAVLRHRRKDGTLLFVEPARQAMEYNGRSAVFSVLNDVTDRVRVESALKESEERTRLILQTSLDAVVEIDGDSHITGWNRQAEAIFGWSQEEAIGRRLSETIIPAKYRAVHLKGLKHFFKTGEGPVLNQRIEITALRRNRDEFPVELAITPIKTAHGVTFSAFVRDISERKSAEEALKRSETQLRDILDNTPSVIYLKDLEGRYLLINRAFERLNGRSFAEVQGKTDFDIFPPDLSEPIVANDRRVIEAGEAIQFEEIGPFEDRVLTYLSTKFPLRDAQGNIYALCGVSTDITGIKQEEVTRGFLTEATELLASSLDYEQTLQKVADLAVPHIADWCGVDMVEEDGSIRLLAVAHVDPEKVKWARELRNLYPPNPSELYGLPNVLRTGQSEIYPDIPDELLVATARDERHLELARFMGLRSVMIVPIVSRERVLGAVTFVTTNESGHNYVEEDLVLAEGLAARAALAIENARLYRAAQDELTERRRAQDALIRHQAEIEALNVRLKRSMRETHHRVKNNLQVVSALLDMQEMQYSELVPISVIVRLRQHIMSLSAIHELLTYQAQDDAEVNDLSVKETMDKLVPILRGIVAGRTIEFAIEDVRLPVRQVTTLTVLVNELVSNAVKHGKGRIGINFRIREGKAALGVSDEGPGFPHDFDPVNGVNTGLELVQTLARLDLNGETRFENRLEGGASIVVEFPIPSLTP
jgi:PAS domain S-box-containing protein